MELKLPVSDPSPYPPVRVQGANPACARAMLESLGGADSEMSTIAQYFYSATVLSASHPLAAEYFHHIAVVEMHHLSILAQLALLSGGDPRLWSYSNGRPLYWSPASLTYAQEPAALLNRAAAGEAKTIAAYRCLAKELPDPEIKAVLERLILDEEKHAAIFRRLLQERRPGPSPRPRPRRA